MTPDKARDLPELAAGADFVIHHAQCDLRLENETGAETHLPPTEEA